MSDQELLSRIDRLERQADLNTLLLKLSLDELGIRKMSNEEYWDAMYEYFEIKRKLEEDKNDE